MTNAKKSFSLNRMVLTALATGLIIATSACSVGTGNSAAPSSSEASSQASATVSATPTIDPAVAAENKKNAELKKNLERNGFTVSKSVWKNSHGEYSPVQVADNNKELTTLSKKHEGELPKGWSKADANASMKFASNFIIQEIIDSPLNGDRSDAQHKAWVERNKGKFTADVQKDLADKDGGLSGESSFVMREDWQDDIPPYSTDNYRYEQKAGKPRLYDVKAEVTESYTAEEQMVYTFDFKYYMPAISDTGTYIQNTSLTFTIAIMKDAKSGKFLIPGLNNNFDTPQPTKTD